jgi:hypothetical protein
MNALKLKPNEHAQQIVFTPVKISQTTYPTMFFEKKTLDDFNSIIGKIERKIKDGLKKQKKTEKYTYGQQQYQNNQYNSNFDVAIGIPEDGRAKIKIKGYKGEELINHFDKLVQKMKEFINNVNSTIDEASDFNKFIQEKENLKLAKKLSDLRQKQQPNCAGEKYKTTWFFSSAFNTKLTDSNSSTVNQQIQKDLEKCMDYLLSIITEYCIKAGFMTPETSSFIQLNKEILYTIEETRSQRIRAIQERRQYGGKTKKLNQRKSKTKSKSNKHITRKHKKL